MIPKLIFVCLCVAAGVCPLWGKKAVTQAHEGFKGWPTQFNGKPLKMLELTEREKTFALHFPGKIARFSSGNDEIIIRWIESPSRRVHPSSDCFKGYGYAVKHIHPMRDAAGDLWGCLEAVKGETSLFVRENIQDSQGQSWPDVSSWYWAAILGQTQGPWLAVTHAAGLPKDGSIQK